MQINGKNGEEMTIHEVYNEGIRLLKSSNIEAPAVDAGVMLCHILKKDKAFLYAHGEILVSQMDYEKYTLCIKRRMVGEPLQYITGTQEFMGLEFVVDKNVLVPRADTEVLVEKILDYMNMDKLNQEIKILDMCTGSGCIAISLANYNKNSLFHAVDISIKALEVAKINIERNLLQARISLIESDLFEHFYQSKEYNNYFDIIVSNPPYIPKNEISELQIEVREFEPLKALDGGEDGFNFYRRIIEESIIFLKPEGILAFEAGYNQASSIAEIMRPTFEEINIFKDYSSIDRVVTGKIKK